MVEGSKIVQKSAGIHVVYRLACQPDRCALALDNIHHRHVHVLTACTWVIDNHLSGFIPL